MSPADGKTYVVVRGYVSKVQEDTEISSDISRLERALGEDAFEVALETWCGERD